MSFLKAVLPIKAKMNVQVDENAWLGLAMKGSAILEPNEAFKVEHIRLELRVTEGYYVWVDKTDSNGHRRRVREHRTDNHHSQDVIISVPFETTIGNNRNFPFEVRFPIISPRHGGNVSYSLKAVANVKGRADVTYELSRSLGELEHRSVSTQNASTETSTWAGPYAKQYDPNSGAGRNYAEGMSISNKYSDLAIAELEKLVGGVSNSEEGMIRGIDERMILNKVMRDGFVTGLKNIMSTKKASA